jgi:glycosyltransferase involved in cell wall biosynthesis
MLKHSLEVAGIRALSSLNPHPPIEYPDWAGMLQLDAARWRSARAAAKKGPKILIANSAGLDHHITTIDSLLAVALTLRGADVHVLICDEALPACVMSHHSRVPPGEFLASESTQQVCGKCFLSGYKVFSALGLTTHRYGQFISADDERKASELALKTPINEIGSLRLEDVEIGEHALAGTLRYFGRGDLRGEPQGEAILRRYFRSSLLSAFAIRRLLDSVSFARICGLQGLYVPDGLIGEVARSKGVPVVSWNEAYRKQTFIFSHHDTYHRTMLSEPKGIWENTPWTEEMELQILEYLKSRWYGTHDWIAYTQDWSEDVSSPAARLGIDFTKPCIGLLTNVIWDAQVHYGGNAFANMLEWTLETIRYFRTRPDLQLIIRIHPAEVRGVNRSRQLMVDEIQRAFPDLPQNVFVIGPDSHMNTYAAMMKCNAVIVYGTKAGVELASFGVPVIVAGEAWVRNKGLTLDASSAQEYFEILNRLPLQIRMSDDVVRQTRKYAYHFFFRRLIPLPFLTQTSGDSLFKLELSGLSDLLPGRYPGLDVICTGIINGDEFIYPAESYPEDPATTGKFTSTYSAHVASRLRSKPLVSVIVSAHEASATLANTLDSAYAQDGSGRDFDLEIILAAASSAPTDPDFFSRRPGLKLCQVSDRAESRVWNAGIRAATGKYIAFLREGDTWVPARIVSHLPILEKHSEFGAVYGQCIRTGSGEGSLWPDARRAPAGSVFEAFLKQQFVHPSSLIVSRDAFEQAGSFDEALPSGLSDYEWILRLAYFVKFAFISGPVTFASYNLRAVWLENGHQAPQRRELCEVINKSCRLVSDSAAADALRKEAIKSWCVELARQFDESGTDKLLRGHIVGFLKDIHGCWRILGSAIRSSATRVKFFWGRSDTTRI